jgi:hypothetical protein
MGLLPWFVPPPKKKKNPDVLKNVASFEEDHGD